MRTIQLLHAIYRSAEVGHWVNVADKLESKLLGKSNENISSLYRTKNNKTTATI